MSMISFISCRLLVCTGQQLFQNVATYSDSLWSVYSGHGHAWVSLTPLMRLYKYTFTHIDRLSVVIPFSNFTWFLLLLSGCWGLQWNRIFYCTYGGRITGIRVWEYSSAYISGWVNWCTTDHPSLPQEWKVNNIYLIVTEYWRIY